MPRNPKLRRSGKLFCHGCQRWRPESDLMVQTSRYERQVLMHCKSYCQTRRPNERAAVVSTVKRQRGAR